MRKNIRLSVLCILAALAVLSGGVLSGSALADESLFFSVDGRTWEVVLPPEYLPYTSELGQNSPLLKISGATQTEMDQYISALGCSVCCIHVHSGHQLWLSVKDHSADLGRVNPGVSLPQDIVKTYYDGTTLSRGPYTVETVGGRDYYLFADGESTNAGGICYRISTFIGHYEVMLRWESGTGARTEEDIDTLKAIIRSVQQGI